MQTNIKMYAQLQFVDNYSGFKKLKFYVRINLVASYPKLDYW